MKECLSSCLAQDAHVRVDGESSNLDGDFGGTIHISGGAGHQGGFWGKEDTRASSKECQTIL